MVAEWPTVTIEDIKAPTKYALAMGPFGSNIKTENFVEIGVPVIRGGNLIEGRFKDENFVYLTEYKADELRSANAFPGDLVFTHRGTLGQVGIIPKTAKFPRYVVSQSQMKLSCDPEKIEPLFVYYFFRSPQGQYALLKNTSTTGVPAISSPLTSLRQIEIPLPPLPTQLRIAEILGRLDDKIEVNRRINRTLEAMAQALFKHWFVDFGPFQDGEFAESELGLIPEGWRAVPLPEAIAVNPSRPLAKGQVAPYLEMSNMPTNSSRALDWYDRPLNSGMKFINGDVLVARITPCLEHGKTAFVDFLEDGQVGWGSTEYIVLRSKPPLPLEYSYLLARSEDFRSFAIQRMTGTSGRQRVSADSLNAYQVIVPSEEVGEQFGRITHRIFEMIGCFDEEIRTLTTTRDYLLPKLLSGEITV